MIIGDATPGTTPFTLRDGAVIVGEPLEVTDATFLTGVGAYLEGGVDDVPVTAVLYSEAGSIVSYGPVEALGEDASGITWFGFDGARGRVIAEGSYRPALLFGADAAAQILTDAQAPSPRPAVVVDGATPGTGPYLQVTTGDVWRVQVETTGTGTAGNAALFAQPSPPASPGRSLWIATPRESADRHPHEPILVRATDGVAPDPAADSDVVRSVTGLIDHALHQVAVTIDSSGLLRLQSLYAPAAQAAPPARLDAVNHSVTAPLLLRTDDLWIIPDVTDDALADLPWSLSQRALSTTGPVRGSSYQASVGWFGTKFAPYRRAQAIARTGSPLADLVGQRVRVTFNSGSGARTVFLWVADERAFPDDMAEDLLITRRAFLELDDPAVDFVLCTVDELA